MGKTTKFHPVSLHVIRGAAEYCGFKFGKIKQKIAHPDRGAAEYTAELVQVPPKYQDMAEAMLLVVLSDCFAADIRPHWLRRAKDGSIKVNLWVDKNGDDSDLIRVSEPGYGGGGGGPFMGETMTCEVCGRVQKSYANFESQWTMALVDGKKTIYWCPRCFGIPDPAPGYCARHGHDWKHRKCQRCGITPPGAGGGEYPDRGPYNLDPRDDEDDQDLDLDVFIDTVCEACGSTYNPDEGVWTVFGHWFCSDCAD